MTMTPTDARPAPGEFRVGRILGRAWTVFSANVVKFFTICSIVELPYLLLNLVTATDSTSPGSSSAADAFEWQILAGSLLMMVFNMVAQAVIVYVAFQYLRGQPTSIGGGVQQGLARLVPLLGVIALSTLGICLGFFSLIIPGIVLLVRWSVAIPACIVEGLGPAASLRRSAALTNGQGWGIFGIFFLIFTASIIVGNLIGLASRQLGTNAELIADFLWAAVWTGYFDSVLMIVYHDLRVAKEGVDIDQIAAVFD